MHFFTAAIAGRRHGNSRWGVCPVKPVKVALKYSRQRARYVPCLGRGRCRAGSCHRHTSSCIGAGGDGFLRFQFGQLML